MRESRREDRVEGERKRETERDRKTEKVISSISLHESTFPIRKSKEIGRIRYLY